MPCCHDAIINSDCCLELETLNSLYSHGLRDVAELNIGAMQPTNLPLCDGILSIWIKISVHICICVDKCVYMYMPSIVSESRVWQFLSKYIKY